MGHVDPRHSKGGCQTRFGPFWWSRTIASPTAPHAPAAAPRGDEVFTVAAWMVTPSRAGIYPPSSANARTHANASKVASAVIVRKPRARRTRSMG